MLSQFGLHHFCRRVIRKLQFDCGKSAGRCGAKALQQRIFGEQMAKIGGKAWHPTFLEVSYVDRKA